MKSGLTDTAVIVAGMGRCGTTMLRDALRKYGFESTPYLRRFSDCFIYGNGKVYKSHYYPPDRLPYNVKLIYMFGNPLDIAISTNNQINRWGRLHHDHHGSSLFKGTNELYFDDTLQLGKHFNVWYKHHKFPFISIKYESLYNYNTREMLNKYLGFKLELPPYVKRQSCWLNHPMKQELLKTYGDLHRRIEESDDVKIWDTVT